MALSGFILWFKTDEGYFNVKTIDVIGNEAVDTQTVSEICKPYENKPIYLISYNDIYRDIRSNITTNFVHIYLKFPDTLEVIIEESPVLFCFQLGWSSAMRPDMPGIHCLRSSISRCS